MRSLFWLTVLSFLALVLRLAVTQPHAKLAQLTRLQRYLIALYEHYRRNPTAVELERFMDPQLYTRIHGIIDLIRGWAIDASEEAINAEASMNYLRSVVLYTCIRYADLLYDAYSMLDLNPDTLVHASKIFRIRSTYEWVLQPFDSIVRFELMQFLRFDIRARAVNNTPYVQVYTTNTTSARFFHEIFSTSYDFINNYTSMRLEYLPMPRNPQSNFLHEVRMLAQVQNFVLMLSELHDKGLRLRLNNKLFYLNYRLRCVLREMTDNFLHQNNITKTRNQKYNLQKTMTLVVLQRFVQFVLVEFGRHVHHPAHIKYGHVLDVNMTTVLNANHMRLMKTDDELLILLNQITYNKFPETFRQFIFNLPLRVGYICYGEHLTLRVDLTCQS